MSLFPKDRNLALAPDRVDLPVRACDFGEKTAGFEIRLDAFLTRHLTWRSRTSIQRLVREGYVRVGHLAPERETCAEPTEERRPGRVMHHGARVVVLIPEELRLPDTSSLDGSLSNAIDVLFEDEEVLAIDKPAGLAVHPSGRYLSDTLIQRVHAMYRSSPESSNASRSLPIRLCHRLDRETSGIVLLGKGEVAHREIMLQFERRQVEKEYLAVVHGNPAQDEGLIDAPLGQALAGRIRLRMSVQTDGLPSRTEWRVVERHGEFSLLACRPRTGRQHQIRVHLDSIGHPLVGDKLYGVDDGVFLRSSSGELTDADRRQLGLSRHALHNHRLAWTSPSSGVRHEVVSPLASDLRGFLDSVDRASHAPTSTEIALVSSSARGADHKAH